MTVDLDWKNLGFEYHKLPFRYISYYKDGKWDDGKLTEDATLHISESSPESLPHKRWICSAFPS